MDKIVSFCARQKLRFDMGASFAIIVNFCLLAITASDKIYTATGIPARALIPILVPVAVVAVWGFGFILDKCRFRDAYQHEENLRNQMLKDALG